MKNLIPVPVPVKKKQNGKTFLNKIKLMEKNNPQILWKTVE